MALQHHALDSLQMQEMRQHQTRGSCAHNSNLCPDNGHGISLSDCSYENFSITSLGIAWLFAFAGASGSRTVHTRFSKPSTASTSPRYSLCDSEKLLVPHFV